MREALKLETPAPTAPPVTPAIPPAEVMKRETPKLETPAPTTPPVTPAVPPAEVVKREAPKLETLTPPAPLVVPAVPPAEVVSRDAAKLEAPPPPAVPPVEAVRREAPELEAPAEPLRVVAPAPAVAVSPLPLTPQLILDRCGAASQIAQFVRGANFLSYLDKNRLAAIDAAALRALVSKHFQVTAFHRSIAGRLEPLPPSARAWLESPLGRWMADLSKRASTAASRDELVAFAGGLKDAPPPQSRLVLVHRLFDAGRPLDMELDATMATVRAIAEGINPLLPDAQRFGRADLDRALASVRSTLVPVLKNARIVQLLFTYRSVDEGELEELVRFWESESGRWLTAAVEQGFAEAAGRIGERLRAEIPRRLGTP
ncbi:MAG: hypothetical protein HY013_06445 [Candidatus Solibacter usitatus]|nr:hypothetical protein [Candidatus Solibacter usitatus]